MNRSHYVRCQCRFQALAAVLGDAESPAKQRLRRRGSQTDDYFRFQCGDFRFQPWPASTDFTGVRFLVDAAFAARLLFKVFHCVRNVHAFDIDIGFQ